MLTMAELSHGTPAQVRDGMGAGQVGVQGQYTLLSNRVLQ